LINLPEWQVKHQLELQQALEKATVEHRESLERAVRTAHEQSHTQTAEEQKAVRAVRTSVGARG